MCGANGCVFKAALRTTGDKFKVAIEEINNATEEANFSSEVFNEVVKEHANEVSEALFDLLLLKEAGGEYNYQYIYAIGFQLAKISSDLVEIAFEKKNASDVRPALKSRLSALLTGMFLHCSE